MADLTDPRVPDEKRSFSTIPRKRTLDNTQENHETVNPKDKDIEYHKRQKSHDSNISDSNNFHANPSSTTGENNPEVMATISALLEEHLQGESPERLLATHLKACMDLSETQQQAENEKVASLARKYHRRWAKLETLEWEDSMLREVRGNERKRKDHLSKACNFYRDINHGYSNWDPNSEFERKWIGEQRRRDASNVMRIQEQIAQAEIDFQAVEIAIQKNFEDREKAERKKDIAKAHYYIKAQAQPLRLFMEMFSMYSESNEEKYPEAMRLMKRHMNTKSQAHNELVKESYIFITPDDQEVMDTFGSEEMEVDDDDTECEDDDDDSDDADAATA